MRILSLLCLAGVLASAQSIVTLQTSMGPIRFRLQEKEAPVTSKNFVDLATGKKEFTDPATKQRTKRRFYDGLTFHRVIPGFMIQGGDPKGNGSGMTDTIPGEFHPTLKFDKPGMVAMANRGGNANTSSCQFFITEAARPDLTGGYTIFGQVISGMPVVNRIARVPRDEADKPKTPVKILKVTITPAGAAPAPAKRPAAATRKTT